MLARAFLVFLRSLIMCGLAVAPLSGCASFRPYDAARDAAAGAVQEKYAGLKLLEVVDTQTNNLGKQLAQEIAASNAKNKLLRDQFLFQMTDRNRRLDGSIFVFNKLNANGFNKWKANGKSYIVRRAAELGAEKQEDLEELSREHVAIMNSGRWAALHPQKREVLQKGFNWANPPDCSTFTGVDEREAINGMLEDLPPSVVSYFAALTTKESKVEAQNGIKLAVEQYIKACQAALVNPIANASGELADTIEALNTAAREADQAGSALTEAKKKAKKLAEALKIAKIAKGECEGDKCPLPIDKALTAKACEFAKYLHSAGYGDDPKDICDPDQNASEVDADEASGTGATASAAAETPGPLKLLGLEAAVAELRLDAVSELLTALAAGKGFDPETADPKRKEALIVAAAIPSIAGRIELLFASGGESVTALLIQKQQAEITLAYAQKRLQLLGLRRELLQKKLAAQYYESYLLRRAHQFQNDFDRLPEDKKLAKSQSPYAVLSSKDPAHQDARVAVVRAIVSVADSIGVARAEQDRLTLRIAHTQYLEATAGDAYAIDAWNRLVAEPINQLASYHEGGVRAEEVAQLIVGIAQLGAFGVIAAETN